jgi:uncharacterized membrane protein
MNNRTQIADLLKGIAVVLMIQVHIIEKFAAESVYNSNTGRVLLYLGGPSVAPVFMAIMGYFIAESVKTTRQLMLRGFQLFMAGMLLNIALNTNLFIAISKGIYVLNPLPYLLGVDILHFAGIAFIIIAALKPYLEKHLLITTGCIIIAALAGQILSGYVPENPVALYTSAFFYGSTSWSYFPLFPWLAYPLAGIAFHLINHRFNPRPIYTKNNKFLIAGSLLVFFAYTLNYAVTVASNLPGYYHHNALFCCWILVFLAGHTFFANELNHFMGNSSLFKLLRWMGREVTSIYIIQWIIIGNLSTEIYRTVNRFSTLLLWFVAILTVSCLLAFLLRKIKENHQQLQHQ